MVAKKVPGKYLENLDFLEIFWGLWYDLISMIPKGSITSNRLFIKNQIKEIKYEKKSVFQTSGVEQKNRG